MNDPQTVPRSVQRALTKMAREVRQEAQRTGTTRTFIQGNERVTVGPDDTVVSREPSSARMVKIDNRTWTKQR